MCRFFFFFKQKTAYEMRISDWSSDVCSSDLVHSRLGKAGRVLMLGLTFKEDVPDLRNSKVVNVIERLKWIGHEVTIHDPLADPQEAAHEYGERKSGV